MPHPHCHPIRTSEAQAATLYTFTRQTGRIWTRKPAVESSGRISTIQNLKTSKFSFKRGCFSPEGDQFATVDQRGTVYLFHFLANKYDMVARGKAQGTAIAFFPGKPPQPPFTSPPPSPLPSSPRAFEYFSVWTNPPVGR